MYFSQTIICIAKGKVIENRLRKSQKILQLLKNNATTQLNIQILRIWVTRPSRLYEKTNYRSTLVSQESRQFTF